MYLGGNKLDRTSGGEAVFRFVTERAGVSLTEFCNNRKSSSLWEKLKSLIFVDGTLKELKQNLKKRKQPESWGGFRIVGRGESFAWWLPLSQRSQLGWHLLEVQKEVGHFRCGENGTFKMIEMLKGTY